MDKLMNIIAGLVICLILVGGMFGVISFSFLSTEWISDPDFFRGSNARAGFGIWTGIILLVYLFFFCYTISRK